MNALVKPLQFSPRANRHIPYGNHVSPTIINTVEGGYLSVWKIGGRHSHGMSAEVLGEWVEELNSLARTVGSSNVGFWHHVDRRRVSAPIAEHGNAFVRRMLRRHAETLEAKGLFVNDHYLTVLYHPEGDKVQALFARHEKRSERDRAMRRESAMRALDEINALVGRRLGEYRPRLLSMFERDGTHFSEPARFLAWLYNQHDEDIPIYMAPMSDYLAVSEPVVSLWGGFGQLHTPEGSRFFGMAEVFKYEGWTGPQNLDAILSLDFPLLVTQSFTMVGEHEGLAALKRKTIRMEETSDPGQQAIKEMELARSELRAGNFLMGKHHLTVMVMGDDVPQTRDRRSRVLSALSKDGIRPHPVTTALLSAFYAQLPGNSSYRPRPADITSRNFFSFASMHGTSFGKAQGNPWGPALTTLRALDGSPVYLSFQSSDDGDAEGLRIAGHTLLTGMTGAGKSVVLGYLAGETTKFDATIVALDVDEGLKPAMIALDGRYWTFRIGGDPMFTRNPFRREATPEVVEYLKRFVRVLVEAAGERVTHTDQMQINAAVEAIMQHGSPANRRLSGVAQLLHQSADDAPDARATVYDRLLPWLEGREYGWAFDNEQDSFDLTNGRYFGFDLTAAMNHPVLRRPVVLDALYMFQSLNDGRRLVEINDEGWRHVDDEDLALALRTGAKTGRKKQHVIVFATHEPGEAAAGKVGQAIIQSAATFICLPNPQGHFEEYSRFLTRTEFDVMSKFPLHSRQMLIKQNGRSVTAHAPDLSGSDELLVLSGSPDRSAKLGRLIAEHGHDAAKVIPLYVEQIRRSQ